MKKIDYNELEMHNMNDNSRKKTIHTLHYQYKCGLQKCEMQTKANARLFKDNEGNMKEIDYGANNELIDYIIPCSTIVHHFRNN